MSILGNIFNKNFHHGSRTDAGTTVAVAANGGKVPADLKD